MRIIIPAIPKNVSLGPLREQGEIVPLITTGMRVFDPTAAVVRMRAALIAASWDPGRDHVCFVGSVIVASYMAWAVAAELAERKTVAMNMIMYDSRNGQYCTRVWTRESARSEA